MFGITLPQQPKIEKISPNQAIIEIDACFPGYGYTLGNPLRRVLLSSLPGSAITAFKIKGISHEFSTIDNVEEDVIQIILNLKKIRFKSYTNEPVIGKISVKGQKKVLAKDIVLPSDIEIINKEAPIATLTSSKAEFIAEVLIERGIGYATAQENKLRRTVATDMINIDSIFSPIQKMNFRTEDVRVGARTDFNKLIFDITTDGSISPEEAFRYGVEILINQFEVFLKEDKPSKVADKTTQSINEEESKSNGKILAAQITSADVENLKMSTRTINALKANKIIKIEDLIKYSEEELLKLEGIGQKAVKEIKRRLGRVGLALK